MKSVTAVALALAALYLPVSLAAEEAQPKPPAVAEAAAVPPAPPATAAPPAPAPAPLAPAPAAESATASPKIAQTQIERRALPHYVIDFPTPELRWVLDIIHQAALPYEPRATILDRIQIQINQQDLKALPPAPTGK